MHISDLTMQNFRNYKNANVKFSPFTNIIYGNNAQGKTNILEAVYMFSQGRSHRTKSDNELIRFNTESAKIMMNFYDREREFSSSIQLLKGGKKSIRINNVAIQKLSKLMNYFNVVLFSPEDLTLIKGSPSYRRKYMDSAISQIYPNYLISLISYHKILSQKNSLLKILKKNGKTNDDTLSVWNDGLAREGVKIMEYRKKYVELVGEFAKSIQGEISSELLTLEYNPGISSIDFTYDEFFGYLEEHQKREIDFASSLFGIQRDDLSIFIGDKQARIYGSQGQQRTCALSLKIAQAEYINHIKEEYPVLLLDDIMSELDINRRMYLWEKIKDKQVLITCTDTDILKATDTTKLFLVKNGEIIC